MEKRLKRCRDLLKFALSDNNAHANDVERSLIRRTSDVVRPFVEEEIHTEITRPIGENDVQYQEAEHNVVLPTQEPANDEYSLIQLDVVCPFVEEEIHTEITRPIGEIDVQYQEAEHNDVLPTQEPARDNHLIQLEELLSPTEETRVEDSCLLYYDMNACNIQDNENVGHRTEDAQISSDGSLFESEDSYKPSDSNSDTDIENELQRNNDMNQERSQQAENPNDIVNNDSATNVGSITRKRSRKANPEVWKRNVAKKARTSGKPYINRSGKIIEEKKPKPITCKCRYKCNDNFPDEIRQELCSEYWKLSDPKKQKIYLSSLIQNVPIKRRKVGASKQRTKSRIFLLRDTSGERKRVCLKFLCATFSISHRVVEVCMAKVTASGLHDTDVDKSIKEAPNKTSEMNKNYVKEHIDMFPRMESHYCRKNTKKLYLSPELNISIMYRLYKDDFCPKKQISPVSMFVYQSVFHSYDPQLSFYVPKKDQCPKCNAYKTAIDKEPLEEEWKNHKKNEADSMEMKNQDKSKAVSDNGETFRAVTFDLQAILTMPFAGDSLIYYLRKLKAYNFTIFDSFQNNGYCYVWDEINGMKGSAEIASCLLRYLMNLPSTVTHVSSFSDTCGGQNRNKNVAAAMLYAVTHIENLQIVDLKYMESGHSYLEADSMHATIERARKHKKIYTTREWALLISAARLKHHPYNVDILSHNDFYDIQDLTEKMLKNTTKTTSNDKVQWLKIKWLRFTKEQPNKIYFKYDLKSDTFLEIDIQMTSNKSNKRRIMTRNASSSSDSLPNEWLNMNLKKKYHNKLNITEAKKKDLMILLKKGVIPADYKDFYFNLPTSKQSQRHEEESLSSEYDSE